MSQPKPFVKRFVYASSVWFMETSRKPCNGRTPDKPKEIYGTMKLAGESITRGLGTFHEIDFSIVRPSAVYGPTDMNRRVSQIFIEKAQRGEKLLYGKSKPWFYVCEGHC